MGVRENFQKLRAKKEAEIRELELRIREAHSYVQAIEDSMKLLPRETAAEADNATLRPDSLLAKAREAIKTAGKPLPIIELLKALGKQPDKKNRVSLAGTLSSYARNGRVFKKTAPNTFGLIDFELVPSSTQNGIDPKEGEDIPDDFGKW
jgi:hypothetical protein